MTGTSLKPDQNNGSVITDLRAGLFRRSTTMEQVRQSQPTQCQIPGLKKATPRFRTGTANRIVSLHRDVLYQFVSDRGVTKAVTVPDCLTLTGFSPSYATSRLICTLPYNHTSLMSPVEVLVLPKTHLERLIVENVANDGTEYPRSVARMRFRPRRRLFSNAEICLEIG